VRDTSRAAIAHAAGASGVDFTYLLAQARLESGLDPKAQASTSSARGLYQFTNATWAQTLQKHGNMLGLSGAALADPSARAQLMALRDDPHASAMMAAGLAGDNMQALTNVLGRQPDASELYLAHFLGADGAGRFLTAMAADPTQSAAALLRAPPPATSRSSTMPPANRAACNRSWTCCADGWPARCATRAGLIRPVTSPRPITRRSMRLSPCPTRQRWAGRSPGNLLPPDGDFAGASAGRTTPTRLSMADTIQSVFGGGADGSAAPDAVRAAYGRLKSMGL
jgi:hypothetical protein